MKTKSENPLLCDPETGVCEISNSTPQNESATLDSSIKKKIRILYFTDPICSSCWGIEPQLRKLKLEYGKEIDMAYHMGGLLRNWNYNSGGISQPSDVASHWDEVALYYNMPIDGDLWLEDPLPSSDQPSIAFKAAQMQSEEKAIAFLRKLREFVFMEKKNITKWEYILLAANYANLDVLQLKVDYENQAKESFQNDLLLAQKMGIRGFPTLVVINEDGQSEIINGFKPYSEFESVITQLSPGINKSEYRKEWDALFTKFPTLTTREYAELSEKKTRQALQELNALVKDGKLKMNEIKNGIIWRK